MRLLLLTLLLLLFVSPLAYSQQQYSEGACILLQQQIDRFSQQKQSSNYRSARREYDRFCLQPATRPPAVAKNLPVSSAVQKPTPAKAATALQQTAEPAATTVAAPIIEPAEKAAAVNPDTAERGLSTERQDSTEQQDPSVAAVSSEAVKSTLPAAAATASAAPAAPVIAVPELKRQIVAAPVLAADDRLMNIITHIPLIAANLFAFLLAVFLVTSWFGLNLPGFKGAFAEYKLNRLLRWRLSRQYQHFRKLKLLTAKEEPVLIDHLVLSPFGIFVIAVKSHRGRIWGSETEANWTRQYFGRKTQVMNPLHQNFKNTEAVRNLLQISAYDATEQLHSVVAFSRVARFETPMPANVDYVDGISAYLKQFTQPCLNDEQLNRFAAILQQASSGH